MLVLLFGEITMLRSFLLVCVMMLLGQSASADFATVKDRESFVRLVMGKVLARPLIRLQVSEDGQISGKGLRRDVTGQWTWKSGYFCRDLYWGNDDLGYNCQQVQAAGSRIRFTSDKGAGQSAVFDLR